MTSSRNSNRPVSGAPSTSGTPAPRVLRCASTADFLAALPHMTGFTADDSLFIVLFTRNRADGAIRLDLPESEHPLVLMNLLDAICDLIAAQSTGCAPAVVITTSKTFAGTGGAPWRTLAAALEQRLVREGLPPRELCCVAADGWTSFLRDEHSFTPRPLSEIARSTVAETSPSPPHIALLGELPRVSPLRRGAVRDMLGHTRLPGSDVVPPSAPEPGNPGPTASLAWIRETSRSFDEAVLQGAKDLSPEDCARLIHCSQSADHWLLMALTVVMHPPVIEGVAEGLGASAYTGVILDDQRTDGAGNVASTWDGPADLALALRHPTQSAYRILLDTSSARITRERLRAATHATMVLAALSPLSDRGGLLALAAWLWWLQGLQSVAAHIVEGAFREHPHHDILAMVRRLVTDQVARRYRELGGRTQ